MLLLWSRLAEIQTRTNIFSPAKKLFISSILSSARSTIFDRDFSVVSRICASFIVSGGTGLEDDIPAHWKYSLEFLQSKFDFVTQSSENLQQFCYYMVRTYADLYKISLHIHVHIGQEYMIMNENYFLPTNLNLLPYYFPSHAVLRYDVDERELTPHIVDENNTRRTIFTFDEACNLLAIHQSHPSKLHLITFDSIRTECFSTL